MAFFKIFAFNSKTIFTTTAILVIILAITCLLSNTALVYSQSPADIQKGYNDFLKGETDIYDDMVSAVQYIIQSVDNSTK